MEWHQCILSLLYSCGAWFAPLAPVAGRPTLESRQTTALESRQIAAWDPTGGLPAEICQAGYAESPTIDAYSLVQGGQVQDETWNSSRPFDSLA